MQSGSSLSGCGRNTQISEKLGGLKFAVVGRGTGEYLESVGITPDFIPKEYTTKALADGLVKYLKENRRNFWGEWKTSDRHHKNTFPVQKMFVRVLLRWKISDPAGKAGLKGLHHGDTGGTGICV